MIPNALSTASKQKLRIVTLAQDNNNQEDWLTSVRTMAQSLGAETYFLRSANQYRRLEGPDLSTEGGFPITVKKEKTSATSDESAQASQESAASGDVKDAPYGDYEDLDDIERSIFDGTVIFKDEADKDESPEARRLRFKLTHLILESLPYHKHKIIANIGYREMCMRSSNSCS